MSVFATSTLAQTLDLDAARTLFAQALDDELAGRCNDALPKYHTVLRVKDTPNVRFRIGACEEQLGHKAAALRAYAASARLGRGDPQTREVADEAGRRAEKLGTGTLVVRAPAGSEVVVDGEPEGDASELWLDPGRHHVQVSAPGKRPFAADVEVREREISELRATLRDDIPPPVPAPAPSAPPALARSSSAGTQRVVGVGLAGLGALLGAASAISLAVRETSIATLGGACPGGVCPAAREAELLATRDRALVAGPLAAVFAAAAAASLGAGLVLWITAKDGAPKKTPSAACVVPFAGPAAAGITGVF